MMNINKTDHIGPGMEEKQAGKTFWPFRRKSTLEISETSNCCPVDKMEAQIRRASRQRIKKSLLCVLLVGFMGALLLALVIRPMERSLLQREAQLTVMGLLDDVSSRGSVMDAATLMQSVDDLVSADTLENISHILKSKYDDFLTLEIINSKGEILGAVGALNRARSPLESRIQTVHYRILERETNKKPEVFRDFPEKGYYSITRGKTSKNGSVFYIRARFLREGLERALTLWSLSDSRKVEIIPITGAVRDLWETGAGKYLPEVNIKDSILWGPKGAEAMIFSNRWIVSLSGQKNWGLICLLGAMLVTGLLSYYIIYKKQGVSDYTIKKKSNINSNNANINTDNYSALDINWNGTSSKPGRRFTLDRGPMDEFNGPEDLSSKSQGSDEDTLDERLVMDLEELALFTEDNCSGDFRNLDQMVSRRSDESLDDVDSNTEPHDSPNAFISGNGGIWAEPTLEANSRSESKERVSEYDEGSMIRACAFEEFEKQGESLPTTEELNKSVKWRHS